MGNGRMDNIDIKSYRYVQAQKQAMSNLIGLTGNGITDDATILNAWIASIGTEKFDLVMTKGVYYINTNVVLPENVNMIFEFGAMFKVANSKSISGTNTKLDCGLYQCFDLSLGGIISGTWNIDFAYPEWVNSLLLIVSNTSFKVIKLNGKYSTNSPIKINRPIKLISNDSEIEQMLWGYPAIEIESVDVTIENRLYLKNNKSRTLITESPDSFYNLDPKAYCSGIILKNDCSNFKADIIDVYGFVAGITSIGTYKSNIYIDVINGDTLDFGLFGNGIDDSIINIININSITLSQNEPEHAIYLTNLPTKSKNLNINMVKCKNSPNGQSIVSMRATTNFHIGVIQGDNIGGILNTVEAQGVIDSIICDCDVATINNGANILLETNSDVVVNSCCVRVNNIYVDSNNKSYAIAVSTNSSLYLKNPYIKSTNISPSTVIYSSGLKITIENPKIEYVYNLPNSVWAIVNTATSLMLLTLPSMKVATRLLYWVTTSSVKLLFNHDYMETPLDRDGIWCNIASAQPVTFLGTQNKPIIMQQNYPLPYICSGTLFVTNNTTPTKITNFRFGSNYQEFIIKKGDALTIIENNNTIVTLSGSDIAADSYLFLKFIWIDGVSYQL